MEGKNNLIVIASVVAILLFLVNNNAGPRSQSLDSLQYDSTSQTFSRGDRVKYPYPTWESLNGSQNYTGEYDDLDEDGDDVYTLNDYELHVYGPYATYGEYGKNGYPEKNACGYTSYGYPDYIGTEKNGQTCADALNNDNDMACLANTPYNYDGEINLIEQTSSPLITCCVSDGTCNWHD